MCGNIVFTNAYIEVIDSRYQKPTKVMNALTVQNPHHKCDWEIRMTGNKKIIAYYT